MRPRCIIKVLSHDILIEEVPSGTYEDINQVAESDYRTGTIDLIEGMPPDVRGHTLIHEILHIIESAQGLSLTEQDINSLASGFYSVLRDNPDVIENIVDGKPLFWVEN